MDGLPASVFEPVDVPSTYAETISRLGGAIRIGVLEPGTRLPPERELATRLGISRSTLRQALAALTQSGHLVATRGRAGGTFVAPQPPLTLAAPFDRPRARTLLDWRMVLEVGAAQLAAVRADAAAVRALSESAEPMTDARVLADWVRFRRADAGFHVQLAATTGSDRVVAAITQVHSHLCDLLGGLEPPASVREQTAGEHLTVTAAVSAGDPAAAGTAMQAHLSTTERLIAQRNTSAR